MPEISDHDIAAEQQLLGAILTNNDAYDRVARIVRPQDFFERVHAMMFDITTTLIRDGVVVNPVTIRAHLPASVEIGGTTMTIAQYLARLAAEATTVINAPDFARVVRDYADRRSLAMVGAELARLEPGQDTTQLAAWAIDELDGVVAERSQKASAPMMLGDAADLAVRESAGAYEANGRIRGLSYGLRELDNKTLGAQPGQLIVMAGRPGMGKTALLLVVARAQGKMDNPGVIFSQEMESVELANRMLADEMYSEPSNIRLQTWQIQSGRYREECFDALVNARRRLAKLPVRIDPQPQMTVAQISARARQMKRKGGLGWIGIDHIGLMRGSGRFKDRVNEMGEITGGLKALAKELGVPIFALAQLNRGVEGRDDKRPGLADLRHSGDIEQDADVVMMLYRESYYHAKKRPDATMTAEFAEWSAKLERINFQLDILIEKQRNGPTGTVRLFCDVAHNAIRDQASEMDGGGPLPLDIGDFIP